MRYALVNSELAEATTGTKGLCPGCELPVIAKCGTERISHWAHQRSKSCDSWWEPETEWHREWKNHFPKEWQENFLPDKLTGEKHIADVRTSHGIVLEFQHSHIDPVERISREKFYGNMVWVVDGTRLPRDFMRFHKGKNDFAEGHRSGLFISEFPDECFPKAWLKSQVPVLFDFKNIGPDGDFLESAHSLYCLFPNTDVLDSLVAVMTKDEFVDLCHKGELLSYLKVFVDELNQIRRAKRNYQVSYQPVRFNPFYFRPRFRRRRF